MRQKLPISSSLIIKRLTLYAQKAPEGPVEPHDAIRLVRKKLRMTQAQLARRVGLPQSHIAKVEGGKVDVQLGTLRKILKALFCETLIMPKPEKNFEQIIAERIGQAARKKIERLTGTMALEKQKPGKEALEDLIKAEEQKLMSSESSDIWED